MAYYIYAYTTLGVSITKEILEDIGYTIIKKASLKIREEFNAGVFMVDVSTKTCIYSQQVIGYGKGRYFMESALNARTAFRSSLFIQKYQKHD